MDEGGLERSDSIILSTHITNNLPLIAGSTRKQPGSSKTPDSHAQLLQLVDDDQFTRDLLREVDNIGLEGDELLTSRLSESSVEERAEVLVRQVEVLKQQLKKQRLMQIQAFRTQKELESEIEGLRAVGEAVDGEPANDEADDDNADTVITVDSLAAHERLAELEGVEQVLNKERAEHEKARATILALQETLTALAGEKVKESHATPQKPKSKKHQFDLHNVLTGDDGLAVVDSPMAEKVRPSEERSDELAMSALRTKATRARTSVQDAPPP